MLKKKKLSMSLVGRAFGNVLKKDSRTRHLSKKALSGLAMSLGRVHLRLKK